MIEPGIYDDVCTKVREETKADGVLLIVINGEAGSGVSSQLKGKVMQAATIGFAESLFFKD